MTLISVIMPVYNAEKYLKESIESILNQTYKNFEFIIINDGSTDDSLKIINYYAAKDNRIRIISRENKGLVYSLNQGIKLAKGKYIARMDADDISIIDRFEKQIKYFDKNEVDILGSFMKYFGDITENDLSQECNMNSNINDQNCEIAFLKSCALCHSSVMMKKSIFRNLIEYNCNFSHGEDYDLWLRALKSGYKIKKIEKVLVNMRCHNDSKTKSIDPQYSVLEDHIQARIDYLKDILMNKDNFIIWGASTCGKIAYKRLKQNLCKLDFVGYVDKYKIGTVNGYEIFKPECIKNFKKKYIFISTDPGKEYAEKYLISLRLEPIKDFVWML